MAYTAGALHLRAGAPGELAYTYDAGSDLMATVAANSYFHNATNNLNLVVEDAIYCHCTDGTMWLRVSAVSDAGVVTTQWSGGALPTLTEGTGTDAALGSGFSIAGFMEAGTSISSATRFVLPTAYAGAMVKVLKVDSGTQVIEFDAGGSGATSVTFDGSNRRISLRAEGEGFHVRATSSTRWRIEYLNHRGSAVSEGVGVVLTGT